MGHNDIKFECFKPCTQGLLEDIVQKVMTNSTVYIMNPFLHKQSPCVAYTNEKFNKK